MRPFEDPQPDAWSSRLVRSTVQVCLGQVSLGGGRVVIGHQTDALPTSIVRARQLAALLNATATSPRAPSHKSPSTADAALRVRSQAHLPRSSLLASRRVSKPSCGKFSILDHQRSAAGAMNIRRPEPSGTTSQ